VVFACQSFVSGFDDFLLCFRVNLKNPIVVLVHCNIEHGALLFAAAGYS
jgi:hypothetical protein